MNDFLQRVETKRRRVVRLMQIAHVQAEEQWDSNIKWIMRGFRRHASETIEELEQWQENRNNVNLEPRPISEMHSACSVHSCLPGADGRQERTLALSFPVSLSPSLSLACVPHFLSLSPLGERGESPIWRTCVSVTAVCRCVYRARHEICKRALRLRSCGSAAGTATLLQIPSGW